MAKKSWLVGGMAALAVGVLAVAAIRRALADRAENERRAATLKVAATAVRTIDPDDGDYADLLPILPALEGVDVVALGEQSHGDGAAFLAKTRLVRFLHRHAGFDVLAFESGLFDCELANASMRTAMPAEEALARGVFPIWTASGHLRPLARFVRSTQGTPRPIDVTGVDCQFSGEGSKDLPRFVAEFLGDPPIVDDAAVKPGLDALRAIVSSTEDEKPGPLDDAARARRDAVTRLSAVVDAHRERFLRRRSARETDFVKRSIDNLLVYDLFRRRESTGDPSGTNLRDERMGENVAWLSNERYRGRKIVLWAASFHLMRDAAQIRAKKLSYERTIPLGHVAAQRLGPRYYSVMFLAAGGSAGNPFGKFHALDSAPSGSLDDLFAETGFAHAFLDLRARPQALAWLGEPIVARPLAYQEMTAVWPRHFDGVFFSRTMFPSTRDGAVPDGTRTAKSGDVVPGASPIAAALEEYRRALVVHGLEFDSVLGDRSVVPDARRLKHLPGPADWPNVLGHVHRDASAFRVVRGERDAVAELGIPKNALAFETPMAGVLVCPGYVTLLFLRGSAPESIVTLRSYASVVSMGDLASNVLVRSYATVYVAGNLTGSVRSESYFNMLVTGDVSGELAITLSAMVHVGGRLTGAAHLGEGSKLAIVGRTTREDLARVSGKGTVFLGDTDLPPGEQKVNGVRVVVSAR